MNSVVSGSRSRTSIARRKARVETRAATPHQSVARADWEDAQHQRDEAKRRALEQFRRPAPDSERPE